MDIWGSVSVLVVGSRMTVVVKAAVLAELVLIIPVQVGTATCSVLLYRNNRFEAGGDL